MTPLPAEVVFTERYRPDGSRDPIARPARRPDGSFLTAPSPLMRRQSLRNTERLGRYSRVDVRATWSTKRRWEFYGEVINLFGARNYAQTIHIPPIAGGDELETRNNVYENFERFPTFGVRVRF